MHMHPPTWEKSSTQKRPKEERKFCPNMLAKTNVHILLRYHKIETKKLGKKEENSKRKLRIKIKEIKKEDSVCWNYTVDFSSRIFIIIVVLNINK